MTGDKTWDLYYIWIACNNTLSFARCHNECVGSMCTSCRWHNFKFLLPIHVNPVVSSVLPDEHRHTKDPGLFRQSPFTHGLDKHSLTSEREQNGGSSLTLRASFPSHRDVRWRNIELWTQTKEASIDLTIADIRLGIEAVSWRAVAAEAPWCVPTQAVVTQQSVYQTLVNVWKATAQSQITPHASMIL